MRFDLKPLLAFTMLMSVLFWMVLVSCCMILVACGSTPEQKAYDALYSAAVVYNSAMEWAGEEYRAGNITEEQKVKIIGLATDYRMAVKTGQAALKVYKLAQMREDKTGIGKLESDLAVAVDVAKAAEELLTFYLADVITGGG